MFDWRHHITVMKAPVKAFILTISGDFPAKYHGCFMGPVDGKKRQSVGSAKVVPDTARDLLTGTVCQCGAANQGGVRTHCQTFPNSSIH